MEFLIKPESEYKNPASYLESFGCYRISRYLEIHTNGDITICCNAWLPVKCGNILEDGIDGILNNPDRISLIDDMDNGKFTKCNDHCPFISAMLNDRKERVNFIVPLNDLQKYKKNNPIVINFSYDQSCNLQCPSCRNGLILYKENENSTLDLIHERVKQLVEKLIFEGENIVLNITGSGDAFASPTYWGYLKYLNSNNPSTNLKLKLMTNGLLMTPDKWNEIKNLWKNIIHVGISTDAYHESTYNKVRKNGSFTKLKNNLMFFDYMVSNKIFTNLVGWQTNFTVQKDNFKELKEYAYWQLEHKTITNIFFNLITQWGHLNDHKFMTMTLNNEDKQSLKKILKDPVFNNSKIQLGNINSLR